MAIQKEKQLEMVAFDSMQFLTKRAEQVSLLPFC